MAGAYEHSREFVPVALSLVSLEGLEERARSREL
jgi:hypothetical protein